MGQTDGGALWGLLDNPSLLSDLGDNSSFRATVTVSSVTYALLFLCLSSLGLLLLLLLPFFLLFFAAVALSFILLLLVLLLLLGLFLGLLLHHFESSVEELLFQEPEEGRRETTIKPCQPRCGLHGSEQELV